MFFFFFFFSSRRRHTRWNCDWSSDVCSSDLQGREAKTTTASISHAALDRRISFARVHHHFLLLTLLVLDLQRAAVRRYQLHFDLVKLSVVCSCRWRVRQAVLVAQERRNRLENPRNFAVKLREPRVPAGHLRKRFELVFALQVIHVRTQRAV